MTSATRAPRQRLVGPGEIQRHVADMTVTVSADVELIDLQNSLAEVGQWAPIDSPRRMTIGSHLEIDTTGPLRLGYGAWRDLLLGVQFTNGRGEMITAGGRTVKNVAGYDLTKFMVGQCGVFGKIETATMRTYRLPVRSILAWFNPDSGIVPKLLTTALRPQWALLLRKGLLLGYLGDEPTLEFVARELPALEPEQFSTGGFECYNALWPIAEDGLIMRVSLPPAKVAAWAATLGDRQWAADPVFGIVMLHLQKGEDFEPIAASAESAGGSVRVMEVGPPPRMVRCSTNAGERQIIERLKLAFDPDHKLQPLVF